MFAIGNCLVVASSVWLVLIPEGVSSQFMVLIPAFLGGAASTTMLVQSSTFVADLIGSHIVSSLPILVLESISSFRILSQRIDCGAANISYVKRTWFVFSVEMTNESYLAKAC